MKRKAISELKAVNNYSGLCSCCSSALACTFSKKPGRPVLQCEEFDGISVSQVKIESASVKRGSRLAPHTQHLGNSMGLCASCENLNACTYPKPEGGVWHCEEYC
jgi:hypothetical protein